ncbi:two-component regulator propeller domain-containing protein [Pontibacter sp. G13]|uniref:two-component regulator propeller domain-containing protein n=1 Tax=Pontibacter sp. G13 TaxID=3074898 RepID=UPI00288B7D50|nr:two-component regulator propeller domain-containing protein [Pontibacter sp. G13]WNJ16166.1 two-component regulator propeller domain-containing protein [Pontibacter sp. G13]
MRHFWFLSLWLCLIGTSSSFAQVYNITRFTTDDGLVQSQVKAMLLDHHGYLWMGTHRGVSRYDGHAFRHLGVDDGLAGSFLSDLMEDQSGNIWMATDNGISRLTKGTLKSYFFDSESPSQKVNCLLEDQDGTIWLGTPTMGLGKMVEDRLVPNAIPFVSDSLPPNIQDLLLTADGTIWIATLDGLFVKGKGNKIQRYENSVIPAKLAIYTLIQDKRGRIWVGTERGIFRIEDHGTWYEPLSEPQFPSAKVFCMVEGPDGRIWLGTGNGILHVEGNEVSRLEGEDRNLDYVMHSAAVDEEGDLWFGTNGSGARKITRGIFLAYDMNRNLSSNIAKSFLETKSGDIWISTNDRGINVIRNGELLRQYVQADGLGGDDICYSMEDAQGNFWFASYSGTVTRYFEGQFTVYGEADGLDCNSVYSLEMGPDGSLFIGTDNGLFVLKETQISRIIPDSPIRNVYSLKWGHNGKLWIGGAEGLGYWHNEAFVSIPSDDAIGTNVVTLEEDQDGRIWVGSSLGLAVIHAETNAHSWVRISGADGAHTVVSLQVVDESQLWVGTENGVYWLELDDFVEGQRARFEHYTRKDGLKSMECNANAILEDRAGNVWIGTTEGAMMRPEGIQASTEDFQPNVYITHIRSGGEDTWKNKGYEINDQGLPIGLELAAHQNEVEFEFIGISLNSPKLIEYRYKLIGVDEDWHRPTRLTSSFYPNLKPGDYTFVVTAKKEAKPWNYDHVATYDFTIRLPWYQTWWFVMIVLSLLSFLGWLTYRFFANRQKQRRESQRLRDNAEKLNLEHQALYAMMNPHFTFNALQSIQYFILRQDKKTAIKFLSSFAKLVRKNLESTKVDFISLAEEIDRLKIYLSLEKMRFPEKFDYVVEVDPEVDMSETVLPPMLLQPFVENSIKHGVMPLESGGQIRIMVSEEGTDYLNIRIQDNGIGIEASKKRKENRPSDHVSRGMQITKDRLALFGKMTHKKYGLDIHEMKDEKGEVLGTEVLIVLPVKEGF